MNDAELIYILQGTCREYMKNSNKEVLVKSNLLFTKAWTGLEGTSKAGEIPCGQEQWHGGVVPTPKGASKGIRGQNMKRETIETKLPKRSMNFSRRNATDQR